MSDGTGYGFGFGTRLSLTAQGDLRRATDALSSNVRKLSSGQRINSAVDDPASLSLASKLKADKSVYKKAIENVNKAIDLNNIAFQALNALSQIAARQVELATQAESETLNHGQRLALNEESNALVDQFNSIIATTSWNGLRPLDGSLGTVGIQAGYGAQSSIAIQFGQELERTVGASDFSSGTYSAPASAWDLVMADVNEDGDLDLISTSMAAGGAFVSLGNGDGSFASSVSYAMGTQTYGVTVSDFDGDGHLDIAAVDDIGQTLYIAKGNGDGTFGAAISYASNANPRNMLSVDVDGDGDLDIVVANRIAASGAATVFLSNGNGTFAEGVSYHAGLDTRRIRTGDFNGDGIADLLAINILSAPGLLLGNGDGTFKAEITILAGMVAAEGTVADFNGDGYADVALTKGSASEMQILLGNGDGTFNAEISMFFPGGSRPVEAADFNNDGILDLAVGDTDGDRVSLHIGAGDGTFTLAKSWSVGDFPMALASGDVNGDGILDVVAANTLGSSVTVLTQSTTSVTTMPRLNLMTVADAEASAMITEEVSSRVSSEIGVIGAQTSRLTVALSNAQSAQLNYTDGYSRIMDIDTASEMASYIQSQILQNGATAMLAQANQEMSAVMLLLSGSEEQS